MTRLHDRIRRSLSEPASRWYDGLAEPLSEHAWQSLARHDIDTSNYGTARVLALSSQAPRRGSVMRDAGMQRAIPLELYDVAMLSRYGTIGLREPRSDLDTRHFEQSLREAMAWIDMAPGAARAVRALVWSVTPVDVEGPEYDTGYSDPGVPFSIFVGAHTANHEVPAIRLAEGVLHEAMHLQLSLIEDLVPLVAGEAEYRHSPWQSRLRPTQGVLHGLYVFKAVQDWLTVVSAGTHVDAATLVHCRKRMVEIAAECAQLQDLTASQDLTSDGRLLATALLK